MGPSGPLTMEMNLLTEKKGQKPFAEGVAAAFDVKLDLELKQGGYLLWKPTRIGQRTHGLFTAEEEG